MSQPVNEGGLPTFVDDAGRVFIAWKGYTIREQFPWTRALGEQPENLESPATPERNDR